MNTYTLLQAPLFAGFTNAGKQLWEILAILPTGTENFVVEIASNTELNIHQAICAKIIGTILTIGQDPLDSVNGQSLPPPSVLVSLVVQVPASPLDPMVYPIFNADITTSIVSI